MHKRNRPTILTSWVHFLNSISFHQDLQGNVLRTGSTGNLIPKFAKIIAPLNKAALLSHDRTFAVLSLEGDEEIR